MAKGSKNVPALINVRYFLATSFKFLRYDGHDGEKNDGCEMMVHVGDSKTL